MKRFGICLLILIAGITIFSPVPSLAQELNNIYAPFESFEEMRQAYLQAVEDGDKETQEWLIELGESTLDKEIEFAASSSSSAIVPMADPDETYWSGQFPNYFFYGRWIDREAGISLSLHPRNGGIWVLSDSNNAWNTVFARFHRNSNWANSASMQEQFFCHWRLASGIKLPWNLEPWKTSVNPYTCN